MTTFTDTQRLDFLLYRGRELELKGVGTNGQGAFFYMLYVKEGRWDSVGYPALHLKGPHDFEASLEQKRRAIDCAMEVQR